MKVYLLTLEGGRCAFYAEAEERAVEPDAAQRGGLRGWAERKYRSLQSVLTESEKGVGLRVRRVWEWLQKRTYPDEPVLRALRGAREIELYHPQASPEAEVLELWTQYLKSRQGRHTFWFVLNALVSPLTVLLAPLPGPNVIGYWFVYRAVCHVLARTGARNARGILDSTRLEPSEALSGTFRASAEDGTAAASAALGLSGLDAFLKRLAAGRSGSRGSAVAAYEDGA